MHDIVQPNFDWYEQRRGLFLFAFGRLKPGIGMEQASANMRTVFTQLEQAFPNDNKGRGAGARPLLDARLNPGGQGGAPVVQISIILMTVVGIVLLIACANIANLLLARANGRRKEIAIRLALGANRMRLIRQLLTESLLLSLIGGTLGVLLAYWLVDTLAATTLPLPLPLDDNVALDARVLVFASALALMTGVLFGLAPAIQASRPDVVPVLKNETVPAGASARGRSIFSLRQGLVISQIALSVISLIAAGLFLRSLRDSQRIDTGFERRGVLVMTFNLGRDGYTPDRGQLFYQQIAERVIGLPGVRHAAVAQNPPLAGGFSAQRLSRGRRHHNPRSHPGPGEFRQPGLLRYARQSRSNEAATSPGGRDRCTAGRGHQPDHGRAVLARRGRHRQAIQVLRRRRLHDRDRRRDGTPNTTGRRGSDSVHLPAAAPELQPAAALHVRADGDAASLSPAVRREVQELDPTLSVFNIRTLEDQVAESLAPLRTNVILLTTFRRAGAAAGIDRVVWSGQLFGDQRTREIGVRMALGAGPSSVLRLVLGHGLLLIGLGLALGIGSRSVGLLVVPDGLLPNVSPRDPSTFVGTSAASGRRRARRDVLPGAAGYEDRPAARVEAMTLGPAL